MYDVIIIGGGPAGLTAALYVKRAGKTALVIEKNTYGGQITWSPRVENFPGTFSVSGLEFADRFVEQLMNYDVELELDEVEEVYYINDMENDGKRIFIVKTVFGEEFRGRAVIAATGAKPRMLGVKREEELLGAGISYCAVCDGEFYKDKVTAVVGGGNTALQETLYLSDICKKVYLIHRREGFRGDSSLVETVKSKANVELVLNAEISVLSGEDTLTGITLKSKNPSDSTFKEIFDVDGLFIAIGHEPDTELFKDYITLDEEGYAQCDETCVTVTDGVFVAGDCRKKNVRQLTTAVADGTIAAITACRYVDGVMDCV